MGQRPGISFKMHANPQRRRLGWVLLGVIAAVCLLIDFATLWLSRQPMAVQTRGFSFVVDIQLIQNAAWGIFWGQAAILGIYLAYGPHRSFIRVVLVAFAVLVIWLAGWTGEWLLGQPRSRFFSPFKSRYLTYLLLSMIPACSCLLYTSPSPRDS